MTITISLLLLLLYSWFAICESRLFRAVFGFSRSNTVHLFRVVYIKWQRIAQHAEIYTFCVYIYM